MAFAVGDFLGAIVALVEFVLFGSGDVPVGVDDVLGAVVGVAGHGPDGSVEGEPEVFLGLAVVAFLLYSGAEVPVVPHGDVVDRHGVGEADDASAFGAGADEVVAEAVVELVVVAGAAGA